jgi:hypothetical protein
MAQNINPFYSSHGAQSKAREEKQNMPKDNHAVSKRYERHNISDHPENGLFHFSVLCLDVTLGVRIFCLHGSWLHTRIFFNI